MGRAGRIALVAVAAVTLAGGCASSESTGSTVTTERSWERSTTTTVLRAGPYFEDEDVFVAGRIVLNQLDKHLGAFGENGGSAADCAVLAEIQAELDGLEPETRNVELVRRWDEVRDAVRHLHEVMCVRTNGEDLGQVRLAAIRWLESYERRYRGTVVRTSPPIMPLASTETIAALTASEVPVSYDLLVDVAAEFCEITQEVDFYSGEQTTTVLSSFRRAVREDLEVDVTGELVGRVMDLVYDIVEFGDCWPAVPG